MADVSKLNINNIDYDIKDPKSRNPRWNEVDPSEQNLPVEGEYIGTSIKKITARLNDLGALAYKDNLSGVEIINYLGYTPADDAEFHREIQTLQENFQAGVDAIYNACDAKGSTPASKSLSDVVAGINNIPTGGNYMTKSITANGSYYATDDGVDAYNIVQVNVDPNVCETLSITTNGTYDAEDAGYNGYKEITVNVPSSGGGDTFMFPQEVTDLWYNNGGCGYHGTISLDPDKNILTGYIVANQNNSISYNLKGIILNSSIPSFSIMIDNTTEVPATVTTVPAGDVNAVVGDEGNDEDDYYGMIVSCTLPTLPLGYHALTLYCTENSNSNYLYYFSNVIYGFNFSEAVPGAYLHNGTFLNYFKPNNFVIPTNPVEYTLSGTVRGCGDTEESLDHAMNSHYANTFDSGVSYLMSWIDPDSWSDETPHFPQMEDTLSFSNGKFIYHHVGNRSFDNSVYEDHSIILPIKGEMFNTCKYINIHCRTIPVDPEPSTDYVYYAGSLSVELLERLDSNTVGFYYESGPYVDYINLDRYRYSYDWSEGQGFTVSKDITNITHNSSINFIVISFYEIPTDTDYDFAIEIDRIYGSNIPIGDNFDN